MVEKIKEAFGWLILFVFNMLGVGWSILGIDILAIAQAISLLIAMIFLIVGTSTGYVLAFALAGLLVLQTFFHHSHFSDLCFTSKVRH